MNEIQPIFLRPFSHFCMTIGEIPTSYLYSKTYYEQVLWLCHYLKEKVIPAINNNADAVTEVQQHINELQSYVEHYFDNLDVQEEIDNKLDEMALNGELERIIAEYLQTQIIYDTTDEMISDAENLTNGVRVQTLGYHTINDGGGAFYNITNTSSSDYQINLGSGLYATLIVGDTINAKQFGCYGDNTHDDATTIQALFNTFLPLNKKIYFPNGTYLTSTSINIPMPNYAYIKLDSKAEIKATAVINEIFTIGSSGAGLSASYFTIDGGIINSNNLANYGINSLSSSNKYAPTYKNIMFRDAVLSDLIIRDSTHIGTSEHGLIINCRFYNPASLGTCVSMYAGDYTITDCEMFYTNTAIICASITTLSKCHIWAGGEDNTNNNTIGIIATGKHLILSDMYFDGMNTCVDTNGQTITIISNNLLNFLPSESTLNKPIVFKITRSTRLSSTNLNINSYNTRCYKVVISNLDMGNINNQIVQLANNYEVYDSMSSYDFTGVDYGDCIFVNDRNFKGLTKAYATSIANGNYYKIGDVVLRNGVTAGDFTFALDDIDKYAQRISFSLYLNNGSVSVNHHTSEYLSTSVGKYGIAVGVKETKTDTLGNTINTCPIYLHAIDITGNQFCLSVTSNIVNMGNWISFNNFNQFNGTAVSSPSLLFDDYANS